MGGEGMSHARHGLGRAPRDSCKQTSSLLPQSISQSNRYRRRERLARSARAERGCGGPPGGRRETRVRQPRRFRARANAEFSTTQCTMSPAHLQLNAAVPSPDRAFATDQARSSSAVRLWS
jgi:hypothetical protein